MRDLSDDEWDSLPDGAKKGARALYKKLKEDRGKESEVKSNASNES